MHRAFSSVSAAIDVALEANVRNLPTLLNRQTGQSGPAGKRAGHLLNASGQPPCRKDFS